VVGGCGRCFSTLANCQFAGYLHPEDGKIGNLATVLELSLVSEDVSACVVSLQASFKHA
jgi:hypothetical protein